ncbi:MAG: hypothetical protein RLZZ417_563, partial [Bacteroidota bacterium]
MVKFKNYIFLLFLALLFNLNANAQIDKTFWFAAPNITSNHVNDHPIRFRLINLSATNIATVSFSQPANNLFSLASGGISLTIGSSTITLTSNSFDIPANSVATLTFDATGKTKIECSGPVSPNDGISNFGILIQSSELLSGYYEVNGGSNDDLFSLKGLNGLGTRFLITSQL